MRSKILKIAFTSVVAVLVAMQFIQPARTNPASDSSASFEAVARPPAEVATGLRRACGDCHSNQTIWPWYSRVAPVSWMIAQDVKEGRAHLNFSEWNRTGPGMEQPDMSEVCEEVQAGRMPPKSYALLHPNTGLSTREVAAFCGPAVAESDAN